jgi:hypothetical protein
MINPKALGKDFCDCLPGHQLLPQRSSSLPEQQTLSRFQTLARIQRWMSGKQRQIVRCATGNNFSCNSYKTGNFVQSVAGFER